MKATNYNWIYILVIAIFGLMVTTGCSEEDDPLPAIEDPNTEEPDAEEPDEEEGDLFYQLIRIENLATDGSSEQDANPTTPRPAFFFSLEDSTLVPELYQKTNRWDLAFGNLYNSFLSGNNGDDRNNHGYGANGIGGICILEQNFDDVTAIPPPEQFNTVRDQIGTDDSGDFGNGIGWYLYDFGGTIMGDGSYEKQHVAYALQDTRTVIVRTAKGNFAKIRMISCYKDAFTPEEWFRDTPHMYFTFEYVLVPAGSTKFEIRS